jgi:hypothetical protein
MVTNYLLIIMMLAKNLEFHQERVKCTNDYQKYLEEKRLENKTKDEQKMAKSFEGMKPLTDEQLMELGKDINIKYHEEIKIKANNDDQMSGVPMDVFDFAHNCDYIPEKVMDPDYDYRKGRKKRVKHTKDAGEDAKTTYYYIVNKIKEFGFDIFDVQMNLNQYKHRTWSSLCGGTQTYIFYCKKNNYRFELRFDDDCDCDPGLLGVSEIINEKTGQKYKLWCDLFCGNTDRNTLLGFIQLLNCDSIKEYNKLISDQNAKITKIFTDNNFEILESTINDDLCESGDEDRIILPYSHNLTVKTDIGKSFIEIKRTDSGFEFTIGPVYRTEEKDEYGIKNHSLYFDYYLKNTYLFNYKSESDNEKLIECIRHNINRTNKTFGFKDKDGWKNEFTIKDYLKPIQDKLKRDTIHIGCAANGNINCIFNPDRPDIDFYINITVGMNFAPLTAQFPKLEIDYPVEFYNIRFWYDKNKDDKCHMTIEGKYHRLSFIQEYYKDRTKFIENYKNEKQDIGKEEYDGDFETVFEVLKTFVNTIVERNS